MVVFEVWISVFELVPRHHLGEAEEDEGGEGVSGLATFEADREAATPAVEVGRGHVIVIGPGFHGANLMVFEISVKLVTLLAKILRGSAKRSGEAGRKPITIEKYTIFKD